MRQAPPGLGFENKQRSILLTRYRYAGGVYGTIVV